MDMAILLNVIMSAGVSGAVFGYTWYLKKYADPKDKTQQFDFMKLTPFVVWGIVMSIAIAFGSEYVGTDINVIATGPLGVWMWTMIQHVIKWVGNR